MRVVYQAPPLLSLLTMNILLVGMNSDYFVFLLKVSKTLLSRCSSGVVNVYNSSCLCTAQRPTLLKSLMQLTTSVDQTHFNPTGEILAISSKRKKASLRLVRKVTAHVVCHVLCKHVCDMCSCVCRSHTCTFVLCPVPFGNQIPSSCVYDL